MMTENAFWVNVSFNESLLARHLVLYWTFACVGSLCVCMLGNLKASAAHIR